MAFGRPLTRNSIRTAFLFIIFLLAAMQGVVLAQNGDSVDQGWTVEPREGRFFYLTHGTVVAGHEFGFFKDPQGDCNDDTLWLSFSSSEEKVKDFVGKEVVFLLDVDGKNFRIKLPMLTANTLASTQVMMFTNISPEKQLMDSLMNGHNVKVRAVEPKEFEALMDIKEDQFGLAGFIASRKEAETACRSHPTDMEEKK